VQAAETTAFCRRAMGKPVEDPDPEDDKKIIRWTRTTSRC
jgi:hypothetical protein